MDFAGFATYAAIFVFFHVVTSLILSRVIFEWEPGAGRRIILLTILWLVPIIGFLYVYSQFDLEWFGRPDRSKRSNSVSTGLLEMDAVFNPGSRHQIESRQQQATEVRIDEDSLDHDTGNDRFDGQ